MLDSINYVILGDYTIASELGKKGTSSDITIYDRKTSDTIYSYTVPTAFPDKIQSMIQSVNMAEYAILNVNKLDKYFGEQIVALDSLEFKNGFIVHSYEIDETKLRILVKDTSLSNFRFLETIDELKQAIGTLPTRSSEGPLAIYVDHVFDVKGVGTVILGVVKQGIVHVYDELAILPQGKSVLVKSIQMHDDPVEQAKSPARVGLAIKGVSTDEISRGDIICSPDAFKVSDGVITVKFTKSPFFKDALSESQLYMVSNGLQIDPARLEQIDGVLKIAPEKPLAYNTGQTCLLLKPDSQRSRIVGKGLIE
jgi:selenocysteine-specific translation elongation factor